MRSDMLLGWSTDVGVRRRAEPGQRAAGAGTGPGRALLSAYCLWMRRGAVMASKAAAFVTVILPPAGADVGMP